MPPQSELKSSALNVVGSTTTFSRWLIPLAAVCIHICIGSVYAWSTFNRPIKALFPNDPSWFSPPYTTFTTALVLLGLSAAFGGPWVERRGPRVAATAAAILFGCGLMIGGIGLATQAIVAGVSGDGRDRRDGLRTRLHRAGQHAGQVVPRPARHGDGHGHHGIRRRRVSGRLSERLFHESDGRGEYRDRAGRDLFSWS